MPFLYLFKASQDFRKGFLCIFAVLIKKGAHRLPFLYHQLINLHDFFLAQRHKPAALDIGQLRNILFLYA